MKILHTADLHIGKTVNGFSMLEDQKYVLDQMVEAVKQEHAQAFIIAGDVYDRAIPTAEAVRVFHEFIIKLHQTGTEILCISGNHDSPERISFAQEILEEQGVHFAGVYNGTCRQVCLEDEYGPVVFVLMPFVKPAVVGQDSSEAAVRHMLSQTPVIPEYRKVLITHYFVTNAGTVPELSDSESHVSVGGLDNVDCSDFISFDYTALGHIHKPQRMDKEQEDCGPVIYSGSPLPYSFSECAQEKSIVCVDLDWDGKTDIKRIPLKPYRKMRKLKGNLINLIDPMVVSLGSCEDYLQITLTDEDELIDPIGTLRRVYPNVMQLLFEKREKETKEDFVPEVEIKKKRTDELFADFYELIREHEMDEERKRVIQEVVEETV